MKFLHFLYDENRANYVGAGPTMLFSPNYNWVTPRYLAIDQGIVPMIENYRTDYYGISSCRSRSKMGLKH
jgi:hypothetical protein